MSEVLRPIFADRTEAENRNAYLRPRDAATLILVDTNKRSAPTILMGRRKASLRFMPGLYVFPGGRVDRTDGRMAHSGEFSAQILEKLNHHGPKCSPSRLKALGLCAIRETYEEAGLLLGCAQNPEKVPSDDWSAFVQHGVTPDLSALLFLSRAITPPGRPRRFDTRFFLAEHSAIAVTLPLDQHLDTDLEATEWVTLEEARAKELPFITRRIIDDIQTRLSLANWRDPNLPATYYFNRGKQQLRAVV